MALLQDKVAVITGGTAGLGLGIAKAFLDEGAKVVLNGRRAEKGEKLVADLGVGDRAVFRQGDVMKKEDIEDLVDFAAEHFGRVDIMVNNAGGTAATFPVAEMPDDEWDLNMKWNLYSTFYGMRRALKYMIPQQWGRIINMSSVEGKHGKPGIATYVTAKHAVHGLTKSCAAEVGPAGITVNALCPGMIETYSVQTQGQSAAAAAGMSYEDFLGIFSAETALKRLNTVEEVAAVAVFLASAAGAGTNGSMISIDGGTAAY